jgi:hypothetical protein
MVIVPYLLSVWAIYHERAPATDLGISFEESQKYEGKAERLKKEGLYDFVESIWKSVPDLYRNLMIKLWLTRPDIWTSIARPKPTVEEGMSIICVDSRLSIAERQFVKEHLPNAMNKQNKYLFTKTT